MCLHTGNLRFAARLLRHPSPAACEEPNPPARVSGRAQQRSTTRSQRSERVVSPRALSWPPSQPSTSRETHSSVPSRSIVAPASWRGPRRETSALLGHQRITFRPRPRRAAHPPFAPSLRRFDRKAMVKITTSECAPRRAPTRLKGRPTRSPPLPVAVVSEPMSPSAAPRREAPRFPLPDPLTVPRPFPPSLQSAASAPATSVARPWP